MFKVKTGSIILINIHYSSLYIFFPYVSSCLQLFFPFGPELSSAHLHTERSEDYLKLFVTEVDS